MSFCSAYPFTLPLLSVPGQLEFCLQSSQRSFAWLPSLAFILLTISIFLSLFLPAFFGFNHPVLTSPTKFIRLLLLSFLGIKGFGFGSTFLIGLLLSALALILLWITAKSFSPSKAAVETEKAALIGSLARYAQFDAIKQIKHESKLRLSAQTRFIPPKWQNSKSFLWKAFIITKRSFSLNNLWHALYPLLFIPPAFAFAGNSPPLPGWASPAGFGSLAKTVFPCFNAILNNGNSPVNSLVRSKTGGV